MRLLFLGDVMGRAGRAAVAERLAGLRAALRADFCVVNGENASGGMGLTGGHAQLLLEAGADVVTLGDHAFDQKDMLGFCQTEPRIIRPLNYAKGAPGSGARLFSDARGRKVLVTQVLGNVFMKRAFDDPFSAIDAALKPYPLGGQAQAVIVDVHCEATSEKMAMGHFCDGRASMVVGTHTHVPTADVRKLPRGTGYITDLGMSGPYDSVLGRDIAPVIGRFLDGMPRKFTVAEGNVELCGVIIELEPKQRGCASIEPFRFAVD